MCVDLISQINGLCLAQLVVCGARVASPPRVGVEFELVRALAYERRRAGEGPPLGGGMRGTMRKDETIASVDPFVAPVDPIAPVDPVCSKGVPTGL